VGGIADQKNATVLKPLGDFGDCAPRRDVLNRDFYVRHAGR
jgi:hypothetical protein